ncbi:MAG TPA: glycosyltransferase family 4 protein, partial [Deltaproteobacteria bacterium]|nr:glycosyltransferase family 4 protein [Deltaproteobacteria bacterium]
ALAKSIRDLGFDVVLVSPPGDYVTRLQDEGFFWLPLPMHRSGLNPLAEVKTIFKLASLYSVVRPDLVHHFTIKSVIYGSIAARLAGIQNKVDAVVGLGYVFTSKGVQASLIRPIVRFLFKLALRGEAGRLITQNVDDYLFFLDNRFIMPNHIRLIQGSGVNVDRFRHYSEKALHDRRIRVLLATRLLWDKGVREFVEAARILKSETGNIQFLVAGRPDRDNPASVPQNKIDQWAREGLITYLGYVDDMPSLLSEVDAVVLPSYREGMPKILMEAAACGLPIIATDVPGCREIVTHMVNGLLVPVKNSARLADAIRYLSDNAEERARMGEAGRKRVLEDFDEKIIIKKTIGVYQELMPIGMVKDAAAPERNIHC